MSPLARYSVTFAVTAVALVMSGCNPAQVATVQADIAKGQTTLASACADVQAAENVVNQYGASGIPQVATVEGFAGGACVAGQVTAALAAKAANDPTTAAWTENLAVMLQGYVNKIKPVSLRG